MHLSWNQLSRGGLAVLLGFILTGCVTGKVDSARHAFYGGRLFEAEQSLIDLPEGEKDSVMYLMERGTIRQSMGKYSDSISDLRKAADRNDYLVTHSASKATASMVVNDKTLDFRGLPFERTMVHAFLAKNYLALGRWDDAGVEARNIIKDLEKLDGFPDAAYCRYIAGLCLELMRDPSNAALQYRYASSLLTNSALVVNDRTGFISPAGKAVEEKRPSDQAELVCFVLIGRSPTGASSVNSVFVPPGVPYAEIRVAGKVLGRSYPLSCCAQLIQDTKKKTAALQAAKDISRIAVKETISYQIKRKNEALGTLAELILFALESPDDRRWETLPMWFQVARVPCPADLSSYEVVIRNPAGIVLNTMTVQAPLVRHNRTYVSFCRDLPPPPKEIPAAVPRNPSAAK